MQTVLEAGFITLGLLLGWLLILEMRAWRWRRRHSANTEYVRDDYTVYPNTPEEGRNVGWIYLPERCFGDRSDPYVIHNHNSGQFFFVGMVVCPKCAEVICEHGRPCRKCGLPI